jgi:hypothetical protein
LGRALCVPLARGDLALDRRLIPQVLRDATLSLRVAPTQLLSGPLLSVFLIGLGKPVTFIRELFTTICSLLTLVGDAVSLIRDPLALVRKLLARLGRLLALVHQPFALIHDPRERRRVAVPPSGITLFAEPGSLPLQVHIISCELRCPALNLRVEALHPDPDDFIVPLTGTGAQLLQIAPVRFELRELTL